MNAAVLIWLAPLVLVVVLARALGADRRRRHDHLSGRFDFNHYKAREITQRGVFDKTKWQ